MDTAQVIARAWSDPDFKAQLLRDPKTVLAGYGVDVPAGLNLRIVENTADTFHMVLPATPSQAGDLSDEDLQSLAGGKKGVSSPLISKGWDSSDYAMPVPPCP